MQKYPTYKPSNIDWIGEIPSHWEKRKIAWSFSQIGSGTTPKSDSDLYYENGTINWLLTGDLNDGEITETSKKITELAIKDNSTLKMYPKDSIVIAMYGATIGKLGILKIETTTNQACCVMAKSSFFNYKYVFYWLLSSRESIINLGYGGGQPNINQDLVKSLRVTQPPLQEQQAIVSYLDEKTALIDELILKKERKIELLKEQRAALINQAVTKGLDETIPMKDSGIEWIGEVPKHWEVKNLKYIAYKIDEEAESKDLIFAVENIESHTGKLIGLDKELEYEGAIAGFKQGDTIFNKLRPYLAKVYYAQSDGGYYGELLTLRGKKGIFSKYLYFILSSRGFLEIVNSSTEGTKMPRANWETTIKLINVPLPPHSEQQAIVAFLDEQTALIDKNIALESQKIEKLKEYRQSLISNVVTGKVKVIE